jgi:Ca2+-transporting ATPase
MEAGLSARQADERLKAEGYNELPVADNHSFLHIVVSVMREPMFGLLLAASAIYIMLGNLADALTISLFALLSVGIAIVQEWRSEHVLEALRDLSSPRALVVRDGSPQRIAGREVVRDDVMILSEGDRVPADARIITNDTVMVDESLLTGESIAVKKSLGLDETAAIFAGTLIVRGNTKALVTATGIRTEIGKIGQALYSIRPEPPPLQRQIAKIVRFFAFTGVALSAVSILIFGFLRHNWLEGTLNGIALGMSMLPEEFPLVLTVFMTMGAWRISRARVLTRKAAAIETLGSATVLCTDKTGTLTQNRMSIVLVKVKDCLWQARDGRPPEQILNLLQVGLKASHKESFDPMDLAFFQNAFATDTEVEPDLRYGLKPDFLLTASAYKTQEGSYRIFAKGAPETVAQVCRFTASQTEDLHLDIESLAAEGLRVLAVAEADYPGERLPETAAGFDYRFLGLAGFADPLREDVPAAVAQCRSAGIRVVMITGDYPTTARAIAAQAGLESTDVLTGADLKSMADAELLAKVRTVNIYARISPDQKLRIVTALKQNGEIVAMTGDGVNDAPSLKAAHIGVAMGGRGTDVAREASSIVLLDDNFGSLVNTIALGRRIYDNLRKAMIYICAIHVPIAGLALLPLVFNMPLVMTPLLIALIEMVIDPTCSVVLEAERAEDNVMSRPPRSTASSLLSLPVLAWGFVQGIMASTILGVVWYIASFHTMPVNEIRSLVFASLLVINIALILVNRSFSPSLLQAFERKNPFLGWGTLFILLFFGLLLYWPAAKKLFDFGPLHLHDVGYATSTGILILIVLEAAKFFVQSRITK